MLKLASGSICTLARTALIIAPLVLLPSGAQAIEASYQGISVKLPTSSDVAQATGMKPLEKTLRIKACIYDPIGAGGPINQYAKDIMLEAKRWNVDLSIKSYTDERVAAEDFKAGQCDAVAVSTLRAKQFNQFAGSFDAIGNLTDYEQMKTALKVVHTSPRLTPLLINGDYQIGGLIPLGAVYVMVRDRQINSIEKAAGKRVAVLEWDKMQAKMVQQIGAQPVASDITNFGTKFNNGVVDIIAAPALAFRPLELYRGMGDKGAIFDLPLTMMTGSIVFHRNKFLKEVPDLDARLEKIRAFVLGYIETGFQLINRMDKTIDAKYWMKLTPADRDKYFRMMRESRLQMTREGYYDPRMMSMLKKVRCKHEPSHYECSLNDE